LDPARVLRLEAVRVLRLHSLRQIFGEQPFAEVVGSGDDIDLALTFVAGGSGEALLGAKQLIADAHPEVAHMVEQGGEVEVGHRYDLPAHPGGAIAIRR
jgi:hypothetical protein